MLLDAWRRYEPAFQQELRSLLQGRTQPLYRMLEYQLGWIDEHGVSAALPASSPAHAFLCLEACKACGADAYKAIPAAVAVELARHFVLVHSEVQDGVPVREKRPSVWWIWGPAQAINAGDSLQALARLALMKLAEQGVAAERVLDAVQRFDRACLQLCEGEYQDLVFQERTDVSLEAYFRMAEAKTGALVGCALELGALVASSSTEVLEAFRRAGQKLGVALQIYAEVLSLWQRDADAPPSGDILNKRKILPVVFAFEKASPKERRELGNLYLKRVLEPPDVDRLVGVLDSLGARAFCQEMAERWHQEAVAEMESTRLSAEGLAGLLRVSQFLITRETQALS